MSAQNKKNIYYKRLGNKTIFCEKAPKSLNLIYNTIPGRLFLKIMSTKKISKIAALFLDSRISSLFINRYTRKNNINMDEFENTKYASFNDFFKRKKAIKRIANPKDFIATATGRVTYFKINNELIVDIKKSKYNIREMIKNENLAKKYSNGICLVFRLSPADFHRYIYCDDGSLGFSKHIKGTLHTVNPLYYQKYKVFHENNRIVTELNTKTFGKIIQIEIGALCVGKIVNNDIKKFKKFQEKGHFEFGGSTIVQLLEKDKIEITKEIIDNSKKHFETYVKAGEKIGNLHTNLNN